MRVLKSKKFSFPSASALAIFKDTVYVIGDDATSLLLVDKDYRVLDSVRYWREPGRRIPKTEKPDLEAATIVTVDNETRLLGIGSNSDQERRRVLRFGIGDRKWSWEKFGDYIGKLPKRLEANIEGACNVNGNLMLANRGHLKNSVNHLVVQTEDKGFNTIKIWLPRTKNFAGVSGLDYVPDYDLLLFTASEEQTASTTADGAIGNSYLGGIRNFSKKMSSGDVKADFFLKLSAFDRRFTRQKIESVVCEKTGDTELVLHLAADNDNGESILFKVVLRNFR